MQSLRQFTGAISRVKKDIDDFESLVDYYRLNKKHISKDKQIIVWTSIVKTQSLPLILTFEKHVSKTIQNEWFYEAFRHKLDDYSETVILHLLRGKSLKYKQKYYDIYINLISTGSINIFKHVIKHCHMTINKILSLIGCYGTIEMYDEIKELIKSQVNKINWSFMLDSKEKNTLHLINLIPASIITTKIFPFLSNNIGALCDRKLVSLCTITLESLDWTTEKQQVLLNNLYIKNLFRNHLEICKSIRPYITELIPNFSHISLCYVNPLLIKMFCDEYKDIFKSLDYFYIIYKHCRFNYITNNVWFKLLTYLTEHYDLNVYDHITVDNIVKLAESHVFSICNIKCIHETYPNFDMIQDNHRLFKTLRTIHKGKYSVVLQEFIDLYPDHYSKFTKFNEWNDGITYHYIIHSIGESYIDQRLLIINLFIESHRIKLQEPVQCAICLNDELEIIRSCSTPMYIGHMYCNECIHQWLNTGRNTCAVCRQQILEIHV